MSLSLPEAQLIGVFLESLLYGAYLSIFIQCMQVLRRRRSRPSDYLLGTAISLFLLVTAHLVIDLIRAMDAFTSNMGIANYPATYYGYLNTWQNLSKNSLYVAVTVVSDAFIMYRAFIVWERSCLVVAIPFILFLADVALGILWVYTISLAPRGGSVFPPSLVQRIEIFSGITLGMNFVCTSLIAYRIWTIQKGVAPFFDGGRSDLSRLVAIIVESGSVYCAALVTMIATYSGNSTAMFMLLSIVSPIIGIVFSSVIVRVGSGLSHGDPLTTPSHVTGGRTQWTIRLSRRQSRSDQLLSSPSAGAFPDRGVQVAMTQTVHTQIDGFPPEVELDSAGIDGKSKGFGVV